MFEFILINLAIVLLINLVGFLVAFRLKTDKLTDFSYALSFIAVAITSLIRSGNINLPNIVLTALVTLWALRLGSYLVIRIRRWGKDKRFDEIRDNFTKFGSFWLAQGLTAWLVMIAPQMYMHQNQADEFGQYSYLGLIIFVGALLFEAVSDMQLYNFTGQEENRGKFINKGLWKYSRHPNYFGEISVWVGVWLYCFPALNMQQKAIGFITPLFIFVMIRFVSGVPKLEANAEKKWGEDKDYQAYKKRTGLLIPRPRI